MFKTSMDFVCITGLTYITDNIFQIFWNVRGWLIDSITIDGFL